MKIKQEDVIHRAIMMQFLQNKRQTEKERDRETYLCPITCESEIHGRQCVGGPFCGSDCTAKAGKLYHKYSTRNIDRVVIDTICYLTYMCIFINICLYI